MWSRVCVCVCVCVCTRVVIHIRTHTQREAGNFPCSCETSSLRNKRPDLSGRPPCKGVAIGVARRGVRHSGERTRRTPPSGSDPVSHVGGPHVASFIVGRSCACVRACARASVAQCAAGTGVLACGRDGAQRLSWLSYVPPGTSDCWIKNFEPREITLHAIADDRRGDLAKHLDKRQWSVVRQTTIRAALVNVVNQVDVPSRRRDLCELNDVCQLHRPVHLSARHRRVQARSVAGVSRRFPFRNLAKLSAQYGSIEHARTAVVTEHVHEVLRSDSLSRETADR